jgi:hypothetical protein
MTTIVPYSFRAKQNDFVLFENQCPYFLWFRLFVKSHKAGFELVCCVSNQNIITKCEDILLIKTLVHTKAQSTF